MKRLRKKRHIVEHENVHRWLVSYADYMTLLFALFVVLYAMAMVNEKPFESITESVGHVFQANEEEPKNRGQGDGILHVNTTTPNKNLFGNEVIEESGSNLLVDKKRAGEKIVDEKKLSSITNRSVGNDLITLEESLNTVLYDLIESGFAQLKIEGDWLEIELNSGLLFPSGSTSVTHSASKILETIHNAIGEVNNYIRVRGYTDNQAIHTEIFTSNWELSVFRATAILRELESLGLNPARMAIEGYGQYYPTADNTTAEGRAQNRKVVIAISKFGLKTTSVLSKPVVNEPLAPLKDESVTNTVELNGSTGKVKTIHLPSGGIRITTRNDDTLESTMKNDNQQNNDNNKP